MRGILVQIVSSFLYGVFFQHFVSLGRKNRMHNSTTFCSKAPNLTWFHKKNKTLQMLIKSKVTKGLFIADKCLVTEPRHEKM